MLEFRSVSSTRSEPLRIRLAVAVTLAIASSGPVAPLDAQGAGPSGPEARLHELVNRHRTAIGCKALDWHPPTARVAEARSADMIARRYFDHVAPDGRDVFDEIADAGIEAWGSIAENIALTQGGAASALELWTDSRPHRRNLENCSFTHEGLGERGGVWTQILLAQPKRRPEGSDQSSAPAAEPGQSTPARAASKNESS